MCGAGKGGGEGEGEDAADGKNRGSGRTLEDRGGGAAGIAEGEGRTRRGKRENARCPKVPNSFPEKHSAANRERPKRLDLHREFQSPRRPDPYVQIGEDHQSVPMIRKRSLILTEI